MALTATAAPTNPRWDDEIVPALRKRLENESQYLSHRLSLSSSAHDAHLGDGYDYDYYAASSSPSPIDSSAYTYSSSPNDFNPPGTGSRIPRPSLQGRRGDIVNTAAVQATAVVNARAAATSPTTQTENAKYKRSRTQSTPYADINAGSGSRATSPIAVSPTGASALASTPSRIPVPRGRSPSFSSRMLDTTASSNGLPGHSPGTSPTDYAYTNGKRAHSPTPIPALAHQRSELRLEVAPFDGSGTSAPSSMSSSRGPPPPLHMPSLSPNGHNEYGQRIGQDRNVRMSMESDEKPFEHWYRGDTARNGGVGELRVGRQQEMLDIASYGHRALEQARLRSGNTPVPHSATPSRMGGRRRADSLGTGESMANRGSLYLDMEQDREGVMDERPLTDVEVDEGYDEEGYYDEEYGNGYEDDGYTYEEERAKTPVPLKTQPPAQAAAAASQPQKSTPAKATASTSTSSSGTTKKAGANTTTKPRSNTTNSRNLTTPTPGGRKGVSPAASTSSLKPSPAKPNTSNGPSTPARKGATTPTSSPAARGRGAGGTPRGTPRGAAAKRGGTGRGAAKRPSPSSRSPSTANANTSSYSYGDATEDTEEADTSLADAIPTWTAPTAGAAGNWDNVVLPTVARQKGLQQSMWTAADGSPKAPDQDKERRDREWEEGRAREEEYEPAPGTFGFDWSRYKPANAGQEGDVSVDGPKEFGARGDEQAHASPSVGGSTPGMGQGSESTQPLVPQEQQPVSPVREKRLSKPQVQTQAYQQQPYPMYDKRRSEGPFAAYGHPTPAPATHGQQPQQVEMQQIGRGQGQTQTQTSKFDDEEKDSAGGCCRCVIM